MIAIHPKVRSPRFPTHDRLVSYRMVATTLSGLEQILANEITALGGREIEILKRAVAFVGDTRLLYMANLWLRTAIKVLRPICNGRINNGDDLYELTATFPWEDLLTPTTTFAVEGSINGNLFNNSQFPILKVKDAIVDRIRTRKGSRPSIDRNDPEVLINLHIDGYGCDLSINSSGEPLSRRGYRREQGPTPLSEVLAAGMILLSGWNGDTALVDPMCGSGTIVIEAAMIAHLIAPGSLRRHFAFFRFPDFDQKLWLGCREEARAKYDHRGPVLLGSDCSPRAIQVAKRNVTGVGRNCRINFVLRPFERLEPPALPAFLLTNPPYGERIEEKDIFGLYRSIGDTLKRNWIGCEAWVISGNKDALKRIGLKPSRKIALRNGAIDCSLQRFECYEGSRKASKDNGLPDVQIERRPDLGQNDGNR